MVVGGFNSGDSHGTDHCAGRHRSVEGQYVQRLPLKTMNVYEVLPRKAPPLGRGLRILIGLVLIAYVTPVFLRLPLRFTVEVLLLTRRCDGPRKTP